MQCSYTRKPACDAQSLKFLSTPNSLIMSKCYRLLSTLVGIVALTMAVVVNIHAQCNVTVLQPLNNVEIQMTASTVTLDQTALATYLGPANGPAPCDACVIWIEDPLAPGTWVSSLTLSCDGSTPYTGGPYTIQASINPYDPACASTPVDITVNLVDVTDPMINTAGGSVPNCGDTYNLNTTTNYFLIANSPSFIGLGLGNCASTFSWLHPAFTDNCTLGPNSTLTIAFTDGMPAPVALPSDVTITGGAAIMAASGSLFTNTFSSAGSGCIGQTIVTYTLTDESGNTEECVFTVEVTDNEAPTWTNPIGTMQYPDFSAVVLETWNLPPFNRLSITLNCDSADFQQAFDYFTTMFEPIPTDNCDPNPTANLFSSTPLTMTCGIPYANRFEWQGEDDCGNVNGVAATRFKLDLRVIDTTSPDFSDTTPGVVVPVAPVTESGPSFARVFSADTLTIYVSDYDPTVCEVDLTGDSLLAVTAVDCQDMEYEWEILSSYDLLGNPTGMAGMTGGPDDNNADLVYPVGVHQILYRATEDCSPGISKSSTYTFWLEVVDDVAPIITDCPVDIDTVTVTNLCENTIIWPLPDVTDNCPAGGITRYDQAFDQWGGVVTVVLGLGNTAFATFPRGVNQVLHIFEDLMGNRDTCTFTVTVNDNQPPSITCGGNQTIFTICPTVPLPNYSANWASIDENCPGFSVSQMPLAGTTLGDIYDPGVPTNGSTFTVTLTVTDAGGNTDDCTFDVTIFDNDLPVPDVVPLLPVNPMTTLGTDCGSYEICAPTATKCNGDVVYGTTSLAGAIFDADLCGPGQPGYTITNPSFNAILWTYDDGLGNIITQTQQVNIFADTTAPTLNCPDDITVDTDPGVCMTTGIGGIAMTEIFPTIAPYLNGADAPSSGEMIDNCGITAIGWSSTSGSAANTNNAGTGTYFKGVNTITYTASDAAGNTSDCTFTVTVVDNEPPTMVCLGPDVYVYTGDGSDVAGDCAYTVAGFALDPSMLDDNCPPPFLLTYSVSVLTGSGAVFTPGPMPNSLAGSEFSLPSPTGFASFLVTWTLQDSSGNITNCMYTLFVEDGEAPQINCKPSPQVRNTSDDGILGDCAYTASGTEFDPHSYSDNCMVMNVYNDYNLASTLDGEDFPKGNTNVVWTAEDGAGNTATCLLVITVNDDEPPVNNYCPTDIVLPNIAGDCNNLVSWLRPNENNWTDNCDASADLVVTEVISDPGVQAAINLNFPYDQTAVSIPLSVFPVGVTTITYTATDLSNNSDQCIFTVTVEDIEPPIINCPPDITLGTTCLAGVVPNYINLGNVIDNCSASFVVTQSPAPGTTLATVFAPNAPMDGDIFVVTLTATDQNPQFLSSNCTFNVTLMETNTPQPNMAVLPSLLDSCGVIDVQAPTANDCGNTLEGVPNVGVLIATNPAIYRFTTGLYNVIWTYLGASGSTQQGQFIEVQDDTTPPNTLCQSVTVNLSASNPGSVTVVASQFDAGSTDHCGIVALDYSVNGGPFLASQTFGCAEVGPHNVELRATDAEGNAGTCLTSLTIHDVTDPSIVGGCPANFSILTSNNGGYDCEGLATFVAPSVVDNCAITFYSAFVSPPGGGTITFDLLLNPTVAVSLPKGLTTVDLLVIDEHGNSSVCDFTITTIDDEHPQIVCPSDQVRSNDPGLCAYETVGKEFDPLSYIDNCPGAFILNNYNGGATLEGEYFQVGTTSVIWTVIDAVGLFTTCSFNVTIEDNEPPVIIWCNPNITQDATTGTCNALVSWSPTFGFDVDDNCGIAGITQHISDPTVIPVYPFQPFGPNFPPFLLNQALFPIGQTVISYTVEDIHGNISVCSFTVEIIDNEAPSVTCPPNQTLNTVCATGNVPDYTGLISNLTDNCVANLIITQSPASGTPLSNVPGLTPADGESFTVTITAQDPQPNFLSASCTFTVTLEDVNLPIPDQASLPNIFGPCEGIIISPPTANDCGNVIHGIPDKGNQISFNPPLWEYTTGLYTVIWTYVGVNGSVQQVQQIQVIDDTIPPVMHCMNATVILDANGNGNLSVAQVNAGITDNCGLDNITVAPSTYTCANVGTNVAIVTATDIHGNSNTCQVTVTVVDNTAPTFNILNQTLTANCNNIPPIPNVIASDACGIATTNFTEVSTQGGNPNSCPFYSYTITRTWQATDVNGNFASVQQIIIVQDITPPTWTALMPTNITVGTNPFSCNGNVGLVVNSTMVTDNCAGFGNLTITYTGTAVGNGTTNASGVYPLGTTILVFTATDPCGNSSTHVVTILVEDTTPPTPVCVNSVTLPLNAMGMLIIPPHVVDNGSFDNCGPVSLSVSPDTFTCADAGMSHTVILTVTDLAGNTATCPAQVNVIDNTPPVLISCAPDVTITCESNMSPSALGEPVFSDSCGLNLMFTDVIIPVGGAICYRIDRNWVANDGYGNITTCIQRIYVIDTTPPDFNSDLPLPFEVIECSAAVPAPFTPTAEDNCDPNPIVLFNEISTQSANPFSCGFYNYTITRIYTAQDACGNNFAYTQIIQVVDTLFPEFVGMPDSLQFFTNDFNADSCTVPIVLEANLVDNCQPDSVLIVINNSPFGNQLFSASGSYPAGIYNISFVGTDVCGNDVQKNVFIEVVDNSTPTAICFSNVNVSLNSQGMATLTFGQIDDQSYDNCTAHGDLIFTLSKDSFDCSNLGMNIVTMTVTDEAGNSNQCTSVVTVNPGPNNNLTHTTTVTFESFAGANDGAISVVISGGSGNYTYLWSPGGQTTASISGLASGTYILVVTDQVTGCVLTIEVFVGISGVPDVTISGRIFTPTGLPVALVEVSMTGSVSGTYTTDVDGYYEFTVPAGSTVTITPTKDINPANGVTSLDFAVIQQHILAPPALKPLTTPFKLIAADENGNNAINGIDIAVFQNTILNNLPSFPNVDSWVFVVEGYVFPDPLQPWLTGWPSSVTFNLIAANAPDTDFIGVKMGDVTDDVDVTMITGGETAESRRDESLEMRIHDRPLVQGETIQVVVRAGTFNELRAYQFDWQFAPGVLAFQGVTQGMLPGILPSNFSYKMLEQGAVPHLWFQGAPVTMQTGDELYVMEFEVLQGGYWLSDVLTLGSGYLGRIAYDQDGTDMAVKLVYEKPAVLDEEGDRFVLIGNRPNPFSFQTLVEFHLPETTPVTLTVTDMQGRALEIVRMDGVAGYNVISLEHAIFPAPGMYLYILETNDHRAMGKLIYQQ